MVISVLAALAAGIPAHNAARAIEPSSATLIAEQDAIVPNQPIWMAVKITLDEGWHTYWRNPGDAGAPTTIDWKMPLGFTAGPIIWPMPHRYETGPLVSFGFANEVWLLTEIQIPAGLDGSDAVAVAADVEYLVCEDICIPQHASLSLDLPVVSSDVSTAVNPGFAQAWGRVPRRLDEPVAFDHSDDAISFSFPLPAGSTSIENVWLFPDDDGTVDYHHPPDASYEDQELRVTLGRASGLDDMPSSFNGVLTFTSDDALIGYEFKAKPMN